MHDSSVGKESACNAGDPGSISGSGRSAGEGIGNPLLYSRASLVAQLVKNSPAMWEAWVRSLGWGDLLQKGNATLFSFLENSMYCIVHGVTKSQTQLNDFHFQEPSMSSQVVLEVKNPSAIAGHIRDSGLICGSGRSPGKGCGNPLQYSCLENSMDCSSPGSSVHGDSPGITGVGCHALLQEIFPTQGSNPGLPHCRQILYRLSHEGNPQHELGIQKKVFLIDP